MTNCSAGVSGSTSLPKRSIGTIPVSQRRVRDIVLTGDEIKGLTAGLLASHHAPLGRIAFTDWLDEHGETIGQSYANELQRHFSPATAR